MEDHKETIKFYNFMFILGIISFLITFSMYIKEYSDNHKEDSYWSRKYDSLYNVTRVNLQDTIRLK